MYLEISRSNRITTILINRPEVRNCINIETAEELQNAFAAFERDDETDIAVLGGVGGTFCAGADLRILGDPKQPVLAHLFKRGIGPIGPTGMFLTKPVIGAIAGHAVAGGFELALWCDLRVVEKSAQMGVYCRRWGVPLMDGGTVRLPRIVGHGRALDLILTGRTVGAEEALAIGLANRVVDDGTSVAKAEELAAEIAKFPQFCMRHDRVSSHEQFGKETHQALLNEFEHGVKVFGHGEPVAGASRFVKGSGRHGSFE